MIAEELRAEAPVSEPKSVLFYLRRATEFLTARGSAAPRLDAEVLLATVLSTNRVGVYLRFDQSLRPGEVDHYRELVRRRASGDPVAYLVGKREFWSHELAVTPDVLIPRPETELLVELALAAMKDREGASRVLDLGTGSGAIAIAISRELPRACVVAVDVSMAAAAVAHANAASAGVAERVAVVVADWGSCVRAGARFDVVVSNPPYVATEALATLPLEVRREPRLALDGGDDGLAAYRRLVPEAAAMLAPGGAVLLEVGVGQAEGVAALLAASGLVDVSWHDDLAGIPRVVAGVAPDEYASCAT